MSQPPFKLPTLVTTSVVRGSQQGESHGGIYLVDLHNQTVDQVMDWDTANIDFSGRGWDRGLRGMAFNRQEVFVAASDELFVYDPQFRLKRSFRNRYLKHCHEIMRKDQFLFLTSTGYDSLLVFDLDRDQFVWGLHISHSARGWEAKHFDPNEEIGPPMMNTLHINNVFVDDNGVFVSGLKMNALLQVTRDNLVTRIAGLPLGVHNARPFRDGVLFNDTQADCVRFVSRSGAEVALPVPTYDSSELEYVGVDDSKIARQGFGRGLCVLDERLVAAGSSPSTITVYDLDAGAAALSVNFSRDIRNAIHGLERWPY
jgi:hypothetical protein